MISSLAGRVVRLRPVERNDLAKRVEWLNDPGVNATLSFDLPVSAARTEQWFAKAITDPHRRDFSVFALDEEYIGIAGLIEIDFAARKAELYRTIGNKKFWRGGYGFDTGRVLCNYGFEELGLERIYCYQLPENTAAHKSAEKLGWKLEGVLRRDRWARGRYVDRWVYSILRDEWKTNPLYRTHL